MPHKLLDINGRVMCVTDAKHFFRQMLQRHSPGDLLPPGDHQYVLSLLRRHPKAAGKIGCGVQAFRVVPELHGNKRFEIIREDDSVVSFSYLRCISGSHAPVLTTLLWAMRCEITPQTRLFYDESFAGPAKPVCALSGGALSRKGTHADHAAPLTFHVLVFDFLKSLNLSPEFVRIVEEGHLKVVGARYLEDRELAERWQRYHQRHAVLRLVSKVANLKERKVKADFTALKP